MITYLVSVGYTSLYVGIARIVSTAIEISATWIATPLMKRIGVIRVGIWSMYWQKFWPTAGVSFFLAELHLKGSSGVISAIGLVVGVALSLVGLWDYDPCAQNIIQDAVELDSRGKFSTVEAAFQNLRNALLRLNDNILETQRVTVAGHNQHSCDLQRRVPLYTFFLRKRRGHLFHLSQCIVLRRGHEEQGT